MQIDPGEYFVVERGFKLNTGGLGMGLLGFAPTTTSAKSKHYDRSFNGLVFRAVEVCGFHVVAECVYASDSYKQDYVGTRRSMNTTELELMTVTPAYVEALAPTERPAK